MTTESITWRIPNMDCAAEESEIRHALRDVAGVQRLAFRLGARELRVDAAPGTLTDVAQRLRAAGFAPQVPGAPKAAAAEGPACDSAACGPMQLSTHDHQHDDHGHGHEHDHHHDHDHDHADEAATGWRTLLLAPGLPRIGAALVLALAAEAVHALAPGGWAAVGMGLAVAAVLLSGLSTYLKGVNALRRGRLNISALMAVAVTGALLIGQWPEAAMVMALYALAEHLEARAVDRARGAIGGLLQMAPDTVEQRAADDTWQAVAAAEVPVGAVMRVKPGARLALDGVVTAGQSAIDQSPVTGESLPVDKALGDAVYAGTLNQSGVLEVRVTAAAQDTQLARIIHAVEQAQSERAPTQAFIDRFAAVYTPAVFVLALGVALLGPWLAGWTWLTAIYKALVLLVIACPCALVIATPVTVVSALANAARRGVLVKGGVYLENARRLKAVALDKTGTLTEGKPVLVASEILSKTELSAYVLPAAAALSAQSDHPVSRAIAQGLASQDVTAGEVTQFIDRPGSGVEGVVSGQRLRLVSVRALEGTDLVSAELTERLAVHQAAGRSVSLLVSDTEVLALFAVADTLKDHAPDAVRELHALGVKTVMLSGDHAAAAQAVARAAGVDEAHGQLLPADKLTRIAELQARSGPTAMVGDGINDAPALAAADIGIAMGAAGTDTAMEAADVVVMNDDLRRLPGLIRLSRRTHAVLWQNIALALGIKAVFLVLALAGSATMWMAVFADMGASLIVVANGLRLLRAQTEA
ncbi:MAG TPA: heavy metal translocating P-type ATPase [Ottowia sp.]|uniref:heavy metal translocating P-type ATPase n=1 Tax=Ottowia sp. TaxID=1898956 RepID=UPI002CB72A0B|nr:heavy metal translocating P-type ATPase [Ottowia sp.]HRN06331.1 heavy metal translocating P-type ATPase [Ottowia sp.]